MRIIASRRPRTVIALGVVSLLTDLSNEMIYPLLPIFLASVLGAGAMALGLIEGVAESTAAILKVASGIWTDRTRRRKPLVAVVRWIRPALCSANGNGFTEPARM